MPNVTTIHFGDRIGKEGKIRLGCSAFILDEDKQKVLLTKRTDNGMWCMPSGGVDPGETVEEACVREVLEETGLEARIMRLVGVYSYPQGLVEYPDGNKAQIIALSFTADVTGGELGLSDETTDFGYFSLEQMNQMDMLPCHLERIQDAFKDQIAPFIK